ncbi:MAG: triose-phosphate isomerase, partial [Alphaproteobacteria bacterium HGW-Alphaproteobacteria-13]
MARRKYVVGNWKMNGLSASLDEAKAIFAAAGDHPSVDVALCPPFTLIGAMAAAAPGAAVGGQDCHSAASGAHTGSVAAPMLADA